ncbi:MAG: class I SAM-dependent methyltransferase [Boseongicola sp.]|nr:class I SAM-dependent methyltransferase [Boseongicola sp.]
MTDKETLDAYAAKAEDYAKRFSSDKPDLHLAAFMLAVPKEGRVLDLGCGTGRSTAFMKQAGLKADALDASPQMAEIALNENGVDVTIGGFETLDANGVYDGIYANFSLLHASKADMPEHLARISKAIVPGGFFHIGLKTGTGEKRDALGRFYAYYTDAEITGLLSDAGFVVIERSFGADAGLDGTVAPWIILLAGKVK